MNTTENNTKIAKFLGYGITDGHQGKGIIRQGQHISLNKLKFHSDWNWLMQTIKEIEQIEDVYEVEEFLLIRDELCTGRIETVYSSVLDFIDWAQTK